MKNVDIDIPERLIGHLILWPLGGNEENLVHKFIPNGLNKYLLQLSDLYIYPDLYSIVYVKSKSRIYFVKKNKQQTIFSQHLPSVDDSIQKSSFSKLFEFSKTKYDANQIDSYSIDSKIIKLISTEDNLYALVETSAEQYEIYQINLSEFNGFSETHSSNPIPKGIVTQQSAVQIIDLNKFDSAVYVLDKTKHEIFRGKLKQGKSGRKIGFVNINKEFPKDTNISSFCFTKSDETQKMITYNFDKNAISIFDLSSISKPIIHSEFILDHDIDILDISYFTIKTDNLSIIPTKISNIDLLILFSKSKIWTLNLKTGACSLLIGKGPLEISRYHNEITDLNNFKVEALDYFYVIPEGGIVFGSHSDNKGYMLISTKLRELLFYKRPKKITPMNYADS